MIVSYRKSDIEKLEKLEAFLSEIGMRYSIDYYKPYTIHMEQIGVRDEWDVCVEATITVTLNVEELREGEDG